MLRIFLSHVRDDRILARRLAEALKRAGHQPLLAEDMVRMGESILEVLERGLRESDAVILCLSNATVSDAWMQTEFQRALVQFEDRGQRVLAVRFERVAAPAALAHCLSVDLFPQESVWEQGVGLLQQGLQRMEAEGAPDGWTWRLGNLPPAPELFEGPGAGLRRLHEALEPLPEGGGSRRAALVGIRGMGRTTTALRFAHEAAGRFPGGAWWCGAEGRTAEESIARLLPELRRVVPLGLRGLLDSVGAAMPTSQVARAVRQALTGLQAPVLLVIDDAEQEDWTELLPGGQVSVLLTRAGLEGAVGEVIPLEPLSPAESQELMDALSPPPEDAVEREARAQFVESLSAGVPLLLTLAARVQEETGTPWSFFEQVFTSHPREPLSTSETERSSATVIAALDRCTPTMRKFLEAVASFEAAIPVPLVWVVAVAEMGFEELMSSRALTALAITELLDWDEARGTLSLHPFVRQKIRERMGWAKSARLLWKSIGVMTSWLRQRIAHLGPEKLAEVEEHLPHFRQSLQATEHWPPFKGWIRLALPTAALLELRLEFQSAVDLLKRALAKAEQLSATREQLLGLARLAFILSELEQEETASTYQQRALRLIDTLPVLDDHDLVGATHLLAVTLREEDPAQARRLAERAVQEAERLRAPDAVLTGAVLSNLALIRANAGEAADALPLAQRAVEFTRQAAGQDSSLFAERLSEQAQVLLALGDLPRARALLEQALETEERVLPVDHPTVGTTLTHLAFLLMRMGEYAAARSLLERAAGIIEAKLGPQHPALGGVLNNLALSLIRLEQLPEASRVLSRALGLVEKSRPWDTQLLSTTELGLALVSSKSGDARAALLHMERAMDTGLMLYAPAEGPGRDELEKALRLARGRQVNPEAYVSALMGALATADREGDAANAARAALLLGAFEGRRGAWEAARSHVERGLRLAKQADIPILIAESHRLLGDASLHGSRYEDARLHYAEAIRRFDELELPARAARTRMLLLVMMLQLGRTEGIEAHVAALEAALEEGTFTEPAERAEVEQLLRLADAARRGGSPGQQGNTE